MYISFRWDLSKWVLMKFNDNETRTKCNAFMHISFRQDLSKWVLMKFDDNHNHLLHIPQCTHMMPSQRKLCDAQGINVDVVDDTGRWRLDAKDCAIEETITVVENDPKLVIVARYRDHCPRMVKLAARSSECKHAYQLVNETLRDLCTKVDNMMTSLDGSRASGSGGNIEVGTKEFVVDPNFARAKGLKKKEGGHKDGSRLKPRHEKTTKRTKVISQLTRLTQVLNLLKYLISNWLDLFLNFAMY
ncbi:hypothetical protein ACSBR1_000240 [Camellia fascicularis]